MNLKRNDYLQQFILILSSGGRVVQNEMKLIESFEA
jgi:hypothetical protein